jgi:hypothetical protein
MLLLNGLTNDAMQQATLDGIPGLSINIALRYMPRIQIWNMDVSYNDFIAQGIPILCGPNILRQWRNIIPFGMACTNLYDLDPYTLEDFINGNSSLYLLDSPDVQYVENNIFGNLTFSSSGNGASS